MWERRKNPISGMKWWTFGIGTFEAHGRFVAVFFRETELIDQRNKEAIRVFGEFVTQRTEISYQQQYDPPWKEEMSVIHITLLVIKWVAAISIFVCFLVYSPRNLPALTWFLLQVFTGRGPRSLLGWRRSFPALSLTSIQCCCLSIASAPEVRCSSHG